MKKRQTFISIVHFYLRLCVKIKELTKNISDKLLFFNTIKEWKFWLEFVSILQIELRILCFRILFCSLEVLDHRSPLFTAKINHKLRIETFRVSSLLAHSSDVLAGAVSNVVQSFRNKCKEPTLRFLSQLKKISSSNHFV